MRYRLRTPLIVLALGPPVLAGAWIWIAGNLEIAVVLALCVPAGIGVYLLGLILGRFARTRGWD